VHSGHGLLLAFGTGLAAGFAIQDGTFACRLGAHLGWINFSGSHLAFMGASISSGIVVGVHLNKHCGCFVDGQVFDFEGNTGFAPQQARA
jgi:uncharacterized membrane protein